MEVKEIKQLKKGATKNDLLAFVGNIASVCTKKYNCFDYDRCVKIGEKNLTESLGKPTRSFEFVAASKLSYNGKYNNVREYLNRGESLDFITHKYEPKDNFFIFHLRIPKMVIAHIKTHTTLSSLCESLRLGDANKEIEYWFPEIENIVVFDESEPKIKRAYDALISNNGKFFYEECTHIEFRYFMQKFYKRKEIYTRPLWHFVMGDMLVAGYQENWEHFCNLRTGKATQKETRFVAEKIKKLINE